MRIPQFSQQVNEQGMPNARIQGGMSPGAAVDVVSNQIDGIANLAANVYQQEVDRTDRTRVMDAQNQLTELKYHLQNNKIDGYIHKKGADVVGFGNEDGTGFVDYYSKAYQDGVSEITAKLGNNRQRAMFNRAATQDAYAFRGNLQNYFVRENDTYQQSVYSASADRYIRNINENPGDFASIDDSRENLKASLGELMRLEGKSATEAENLYLKNVSSAHMANLNAFIENGNLKAATMYRNKYGVELSLKDSIRVQNEIQQKIEDQQVEALVNFAITGSQENSNPALNAPPQVSQAIAQELKGLTPQQMKAIKYNDQRLDVYTVHAGHERGLDHFTPLVLGLRLAGEKSNNNQVSEVGARSVMQFIPSTWYGKEGEKNGYMWNRKTGKKRDINNPTDVIDAAFDYVEDVSKRYKTKDPMVIAAQYHGGDTDAKLVLSGQQPNGPRGRAYLERMDTWLTSGISRYADLPAISRQQAFDRIDSANVPLSVKEKAQASMGRRFSAQDGAKKEAQNEAYDYFFKGINSGQFTYEQISVSELDVLAPNQIKDLKSVSKATYNKDIKTDPTIYSMIMLNKEELFKGKPQSVLHQYTDKLSPTDYRNITQMYLDVNKNINDSKKTDVLDISPQTVSDHLNPYLPMLGITDKSNKKQIEHYSAVQADVTQTLKEAEARKGSKLTKDEYGRIVLKTIGLNSQITSSRSFLGVPLTGNSETTLNRIYSVKSKDDIAPNTQRKIDDLFKKQGRDTSKVTLAEYLNAYYSMMRRGF